MAMGYVGQAIERLREFSSNQELTLKISGIEHSLESVNGADAEASLSDLGVDSSLLLAALDVKRASAQIDTIVHTVGIVMALPRILENDEQIESLSLGAGNTGRDHDLETDRRIAEFKFIEWKGGAESIRQNGLFADIVNLDLAETDKRRCMYVVHTRYPLKFLRGRRAVSSVLSRHTPLLERFHAVFGDEYPTVGQYWRDAESRVELVDLRDLLPEFEGSG